MSSNGKIESGNEISAASALAGFAKEPKEETEDHKQEGEEFHIPQRFTKSGRKRAVPFTIKLMKVLSDKKNAHIITWMPSGKSFNILKPKAFVADILPEFFKTAKYSSFTRKLHRWGFMRHYRGEEAGAFYHKNFQRDRLDLVEQMTCHKGEPPKSARPSEPKTFAAMPARNNPPAAMGAHAAMGAPATPKSIKMSLLKAPTSALAGTPSIRTPTLGAPSLSVNIAAALPLAAPQATNSDRLNAAIELEVNRRLKERINAVALQRQAFAVSALRHRQLALNPPPAPTQQQMAALLLQKQVGLFKTVGTMPLGVAPTGYRILAPEGSSPGAPPTNIQGARTA